MRAISDLTPQESSVLALVAQGKRNADIAQELNLSVRTVESYRAEVMEKMQAESVAAPACQTAAAGVLVVIQLAHDLEHARARHFCNQTRVIENVGYSADRHSGAFRHIIVLRTYGSVSATGS